MSVSILIEQPGIELKALDQNGKIPLHYACEIGFPEGVQALLLKADPGINSTDLRGRTPLHYAVLAGSLEIVRLLFTVLTLNPNIPDILVTFQFL